MTHPLSLSSQEVDSKIKNALSGILGRLQKIEERFPAGVTPLEELRGLVAEEIGKLTPQISPSPATPLTQPPDRGLFLCVGSLAKKGHHERLRVLIEQ